jgi:hypothetical protein
VRVGAVPQNRKGGYKLSGLWGRRFEQQIPPALVCARVAVVSGRDLEGVGQNSLSGHRLLLACMRSLDCARLTPRFAQDDRGLGEGDL